MQFMEAWELYEADKKIEGFRPATLKSYHLQTVLMDRYFEGKSIEDITTFDLKQYLIESGTHLKQSSLGTRIRFIRAFFRWAADEGYCPGNPARKLREPKLPPRVPKAFSEEETEKLREACVTLREHALVEFMYSTGCRVGEVYLLNRADMDWENRSCVVLGKGGKEREVYFSLKAKIWLQWYLNKRQDKDPALFVTERRPIHRIEIATIRWIVKKVGQHTGMKLKVYPHKWRHTFATHLLNRGAPLEGVQSLLGHTKIETTMIYCELSGVRRKEIHTKYF